MIAAKAEQMTLDDRQRYVLALGMVTVYPLICKPLRLLQLAKARGFANWEEVVKTAAIE